MPPLGTSGAGAGARLLVQLFDTRFDPEFAGDREAQAEYREARVPQQPYVYQTKSR